ncbi:MAG: PAS domain S-box protein [Desulfobacterales bacterium]|nr:PAS domain S-box protein [Desulfobacterales bacterium]
MYEQFNNLLEDISDPIYLMDPEGAIQYLNEAARGVLGFECTSNPLTCRLSDCHPKWAEEMIREQAIPSAIANGRWRGESALLTRNGMVLPVFQTIHVQRTSLGGIAHLSAVFKADTGDYFEKARKLDRLTQLETLIQLSKHVMEETRRSAVIQQVVSAACALTKGNVCIFCKITPAGRAVIDKALDGSPACELLMADIWKLLDAPKFLADLARKKSLRLVSAEFYSYSEKFPNPSGETTQAGLKHLVSARLDEPAGEGGGMILVGNTDNVAFTPEDEAMLIHLAAFTELALRHIHSNKEARRRSREMELIFTNLKEAVMVCDVNGSPVMANPACVAFLGFDPVGTSCRNVARQMRLQLPDGTRIFSDEMPYARALRGESVLDERYYGYDDNDNPLVYIISSTPLYRDDEVVGAVTVWRDETDLERLTEQLISEQSALQTIIRSAPEGIVVVDKECRITMANPTAVRLYGREVPYGQPLAAQTDLSLMHPDGTPFDPMDLPLSRSVFNGEVLYDQEMAISLPDGRMRYLLVNTTPIKNQAHEVIGGVGVFHDITQRRSEKVQLQQDKNILEKRVAERNVELEHLVETLKTEIEERKRVEQKLRESQQELRLMSRRTLEALEADKQAVAKELHDSIGASLAAIKFSLEERLSAMQSVPDVDTISLEKIVSYLLYTIKETKRIAAELRPTTLDDLGLLATIDWFCREFSGFYKNIEITNEITIHESELSDAMKIVIYRILQESFNNAAKHAEASNIHFTLGRYNGGIQMVVTDDGSGFVPKSDVFAEDPLTGHGIEGMRERAELCGGQLEINSREGEGTKITVTLPL